MVPKSVLLLVLVAKVWSLPQQQQIDLDDYQSRFNTLQRQVENSAKFMLENLNEESRHQKNHYKNAVWEFETDLTNQKKQKKIDAALEYSNWSKQSRNQVQTWKDLWPQIADKTMKRQFTLMSRPKTIDLPDEDLAEFHQILANMDRHYSTATICKDLKCGLSIYPEVTEEFRTSRDYEDLKRMWLAWRRSSGRSMRPQFRDYVNLANRGAQNIELTNLGQMWRVPYESSNLKGDVKAMYNEMLPMYKHLHAYVRMQLRKYYGEANVPKKGPIPSHLLGDIFAEDWSNIYDIVVPYPDQPNLDISEHLKKKGYTSERIYRLADDFYKSMDMEAVPETFWRNSVFKKPSDREMVCQPSTFDFSSENDIRVKECAEPSMKQFMNAHHEMGHAQYYMQYRNQPEVFKQPANPAMHEAVGDAIALSVSTPEYLHKLNLLESPQMNDQQEINFLMQQALRTLPAMPYSYALESWRWELFEGKTNFDDMNCKYVDRRFDMEGVKPPSLRSEEDFDAGAKLEVASNEEYIRYFLSKVLQFQFYKGMCQHARQYTPGDSANPMHKCNLYQSKEAGKHLSNMMKLGASRPWNEALQTLTGEKEMSTAAMREYFKPLENFLQKELEKNGEFIGWERDGQYCQKEFVNPSQRSDQRCTFVKTPEGMVCA